MIECKGGIRVEEVEGVADTWVLAGAVRLTII